MRPSSVEPVETDWPVFFAALGLLVAVCVPLFAFPRRSEQVIQQIYDLVTRYLGIFYLWGGAAAVLFCVWLAAGRFGNVKLGPPDSRPRFSNFSWVSMLFCAGVASSILYWGTIEWSYYYESPPFGVEPRSAEAVKWASVFGIFHWGPTGWAFNCIPALAIGHAYHCRGIPRLRLSTACHAVLGDRTDGGVGWLFDLCFIVGLLGATGTTLGFGTPMIAAGVSRILEIPESYQLTVAIAIVCALIFSASVYAGLEKGIRRLSNLNLTVALMFLAFVAAVGPAGFLVEKGAEAVATLLTGFISMHTLAGPLDVAHYQFARDWTIFYWAWWIALGPLMGLFIAQISRGRTFRQIIIGSMLFGSLGCAMFYLVLGNYALFQQLTSGADIVAVKTAAGAPHAIITVIASLPYPALVVPLFCLISLIFLATTFDSASYALASSASKSLGDQQPPARWHRLFWAFMLALLPMALLAGDSGAGRLRSMQTASLIASVPLLAIFVIMAVSLVKALRKDSA